MRQAESSPNVVHSPKDPRPCPKMQDWGWPARFGGRLGRSYACDILSTPCRENVPFMDAVQPSTPEVQSIKRRYPSVAYRKEGQNGTPMNLKRTSAGRSRGVVPLRQVFGPLLLPRASTLGWLKEGLAVETDTARVAQRRCHSIQSRAARLRQLHVSERAQIRRHVPQIRGFEHVRGRAECQRRRVETL